MGGGGEGDRVRLVEGEGGEVWGEDEETAGQRDVMSEAEIQNVKVRGRVERRETQLVRSLISVFHHVLHYAYIESDERAWVVCIDTLNVYL